VVADGETLPFPDGSFDIVFMCGALHHFEQPHGILSEATRVLKPGGRFVAAGEPAISLFSRESDVQAHMDEVRVGIIERRPKVHGYWWSLRRAGLRRVLIDTFETRDRTLDGLRRWIRAVRDAQVGAVRTRYKPLAWLLFTLLLPLPRRAASFLALEANGANLYVRAVKPR
jgi:SAM-dependent methyltransferase